MSVFRLSTFVRLSPVTSRQHFAMYSQQTTSTSPPGPVENAIREKLTTLLQPTSITVTNDSWQHRHHAAMREPGAANGETHFTVHIISKAFESKSTIQRHRMVYSALSDELAQGLHALTLKTKTEAEIAMNP